LSFATKKTNTVSNFSLHRHTESNTSICLSDAPLDSSTPVQSPRERPSRLHTLSPLPLPLPLPRCIHEVPSPSMVLTPDVDNAFPELSYCTCAETQQSLQEQKPAVRHTGYIEPVDEDLELRSFESTRGMYSRTLQVPFDDHKVSLFHDQMSPFTLIVL